MRTVLADAGYASEDNFTRAEQHKLRLLVPLRKDPNLHPTSRRESAPRPPCPPPFEPADECATTAARPTTSCVAKPWNPCSDKSSPAGS